jgi:hypothetical protein
MAEDLIHCPSCNFQLRLPPDLYGREVECPQCHTRFTAPVPRAAPAGEVPPTVRPYDAGRPPAVDFAEPAYGRPAGGALTAPAVALLVVSLLSVTCDVLGLLWGQMAQANPQIYEQQMQKEMDKNRDLTPQDREHLKTMLALDNVVRFIHLDCGGSLAANLITLLGAVQMLRRRTYGLAVLGCVLALNPANLPCCLIQVPFGIWGLIALMGESGRRAFR